MPSMQVVFWSTEKESYWLFQEGGYRFHYGKRSAEAEADPEATAVAVADPEAKAEAEPLAEAEVCTHLALDYCTMQS